MLRPSLLLRHTSQRVLYRHFHSTPCRPVIKPFILADIGEGIRECEVIQWFVEPEARVEEFDKLCEVQSDKASVEITSRYNGVVRKLHYEAGDMALVGKPLVDIDIMDEVMDAEVEQDSATPVAQTSTAAAAAAAAVEAPKQSEAPTISVSKHASLATPAVRRLCKELGIAVEDVRGAGKDGRVLKEDVQRYADSLKESKAPFPATYVPTPSASADQLTPLTPIQHQMFKTMTRSLTIPHFLYSDEVALDSLDRIRKNKTLTQLRLTFMPFIIKAVSTALESYPVLNSRVEAKNGEKPMLMTRKDHNIGVAMDTPSGLLVPNIKSVQHLSISEIAQELSHLQGLAAQGKLSPSDLTGGTITVSNIGNIGGAVVAPVIVPSEVAILGIGRARKLPRFDENDELVKLTIAHFCWSADHRVIDGATMARMGTMVKELLEEPEKLLIRMR